MAGVSRAIFRLHAAWEALGLEPRACFLWSLSVADRGSALRQFVTSLGAPLGVVDEASFEGRWFMRAIVTDHEPEEDGDAVSAAE